MEKKIKLPFVKTNIKAGGWMDDVKENAGKLWESGKDQLKNLNDKLKY